ncbi:MAG: hypothetical protein N2167_10825 [Flavobacteriales bacterium]|nr:hypothetical protein [Flavobacteriales bacterium]
MNIRNIFIILPSWVVFIMACTSCNQPNTVQNTKRYFDIPGFFAFQAERLKKSEFQVEKKLYLNGREETVSSPAASISWEKEFLLFTQCNLNKPALLDAYEIEVINTGAQQMMIYRLAHRTAPVKWVKILHRNEPELTELEIKTRNLSLMNIQETELWFKPHGYAIRKKIIPRFWGRPSLLVVEARFIDINS